jgi:hypothetical protein
MTSTPHPTEPAATPSTVSHTPTAGKGERVMRLVVFLTAPFLVLAYYLVVVTLKLIDRGHEPAKAHSA